MSLQERRFHLVDFNIARARGPIDSPVMHGFTSRLDEINAIADAAPGFVWRLETEAGNATSIRPYEDDRMLINLTVWESIEALSAFVYRTAHGGLVRDGQGWFESLGAPPLVLWWTPVGDTPTVEEGMARLDRLRAEGPTPDGFTFRVKFPPPSG